MKTSLAYPAALEIAKDFASLIAPACARVEIAGSLRRKKPEVGDIEIVCVPIFKAVTNLLGETVPGLSELDHILTWSRIPIRKGGEKYKQLTYQGMTVDLFVQPDPRTWGVNFTLRTGSADFSKWLVTSRQKGGACPSNMHVRDGRLWLGSLALDTWEEKDFFAALGLPWIEPEKRIEGRWRK